MHHIPCSCSQNASTPHYPQEAAEAAAKDKADLERKLATAQQYISQLTGEKAAMNAQLKGATEDLTHRLENACQQRNSAREEVRCCSACAIGRRTSASHRLISCDGALHDDDLAEVLHVMALCRTNKAAHALALVMIKCAVN